MNGIGQYVEGIEIDVGGAAFVQLGEVAADMGLDVAVETGL